MSTGATRDRIPHAVRSARMRQRLSEAAYEVIKDGGYTNFRTSAVSKYAGVSQGAQLHHYPTKNSLALAAIEHAFSKAFMQFEENLTTKADGQQLIDLILKDLADFYFSEYFKVALDILMASRKNHELTKKLTKLSLKNRNIVERAWLERLVDNGWSLTLAEDMLALSHSMIRGFAIRTLIHENEVKFEPLLNRWRQIVLSLSES